jgi:hypothetical protein
MSGGISAATMAEISLGAMVASAGVGAYGAASQAHAASEAASYNAQVAADNQSIANQNAQTALQTGEQEETAKQQQTAQQISSERAATAAGGIDPNTGSAVRIQGSTAALGALDAQTIANNAARTAWGYQTQGVNFGDQAALLQSQASSASTAGALGAFSSIIGGASSVSSKWVTYNTQGVNAVDPWAT